ncbi:hypothetical protein BD779DRAFT_1673098 [Infundibulicybe gibba]|nr:hypothetical protein BD779DRAFT_1673098 [Infundibulicybe gibba]
MKLKEIRRTSTFAWSPAASLPLLATGTVAGALDESFSNESQLEIWEPNFLDKHEYELGGEGQHGPKGLVTDTSRFNRLAWGSIDNTRPHGVIAAGMENGELALWDPSKILASADVSESLILRNTTHTGPVRGLDFNPIQTSLLASGGINGEVYIWDLKDPSKPYTPTPGARSTKLDEITSVAWNQQVQYVLAGASSTGYTVVWDLRGKREVVALAYGGGAGTLAGQVSSGSGLAVGGRRGMSDIAWHPDNATRVVTASEDDSSPIIMVWDLRNARAPEKILTGHEKGVLSLSWCKQDADLLLSCGKDNRALCWNPQTSEIIGELPSADNWAFQVDWCPRNPDLLATAFFDGTVGIHSIQSTNDAAANDTKGGTLSLKQPPKWLRRPVSSSFGFGGKLVTVSNLPSAQGKNQSSVVHVRKVVTEQDLVDRAIKLQAAIDSQALKDFAEQQMDASSSAKSSERWKALLSLFRADSRDELVTLLGFSKSEIAARVAQAVENLRASVAESPGPKSSEDESTENKTHEPVVSFAEPERQTFPDEIGDGDDAAPGSAGIEKTPSEVSASAASDVTSATRLADGESTTTVPSLFGDEVGPGTPQLDAGADFFSRVGGAQEDVLVPHTNYAIDSSVAATIGSGPSSVTSETLRNNSFRIYPTDESETDRLVTKALVLGDFESAVSLCLSSNRFADAILLAARGGQDLLQRTQKAYFEKNTTALPYLRLFQSIVTNDLSDIVQNADLQEWQEIFVVLCTFASREEFANLAEQLGSRLEFQFTLSKSSEHPIQAQEFRKNATLTYLAAGRLERLVNIWIEESLEEERALVSEETGGSHYSAHAQALQTFVEKVTVFRSATNYEDSDLSQSSPDEPSTSYKLAALYDKYFEYAELLTTQGLIKEAMSFTKLTPDNYKGSGGQDLSVERDRLAAAISMAKVTDPSSSTAQAPTQQAPAARAPAAPYGGYPAYPSTHQAPAQPLGLSTQPVAYAPYSQAVPHQPLQATTGYAPATTQPTQYAPPVTNAPYNPQNSLTQPPHLRAQNQPQPIPVVPPPPRVANSTPSNAPLPPPPKRHENGGWNDAPAVAPPRGPAALNLNKPAAITSPFPNSTPSPTLGGSPYSQGQPQAPLPPPPRPGSVQARPPPPPGQRMPGPPQPGGGMYPPQARPPSRSTLPPQGAAPPSRMMSPSQPPRQPTPSQYAPPPTRAPVPGQTPPPNQPGPYGRPPLPAGQHQALNQAPNPYGTPPPQTGAYAPSAPMQQPPQQQQQQPQPGPYGPPPGGQRSAPPQGQPPAGATGPPRAAASAAARAAPPPPKYPPGDRTHIPESARPAFNVISEQLNRMRQTTPPQQKRLVDDLERRINPLFDALNCETLSQPVVDQLVVLTRAMESHDRPAALAIHVDLLTRGSQTDDIGLWMSGIKQLIMRL